MPAIDISRPDFMSEPELEQFADSVSGFFGREAPPEVVQAWRDQGRVDLEMWRKSGEQGLLGV
ncbi:MAG: acyl-CoA dehydrogenase family protein, partial [Sphingorhabdus sp.]